MALTSDQQATLDKLTTWVDEGRKLFDLAAAFGLGTLPGVETLAKPIVDGVADLVDLADKMSKGQLTALQTAVEAADAAAATLEDEKFKP